MENYLKYARTIIPNTEESLSKIIAKVASNSVVLDVGCSTGMLGRYLALEKDCTVDGVDVDEVALQQCKQGYRKTACKNLEHENLTDVFDAESYDYIVVADVVEHLVDPDKLFSQLKLLVKPNGLIISLYPILHMWQLAWSCCWVILVINKTVYWIAPISGSILIQVLLLN